MEENKESILLPASIVIAGIIVAAGLIIDIDEPTVKQQVQKNAQSHSESLELPVSWQNLGKRMVENGTIDEAKFRALYQNRENLKDEVDRLLSGEDNGKLKITQENAGLLLNLLWALGLSSKNEILETGEMADPRYGGPDKFASTAGWTIARGTAMNHYSAHHYFELTPEEQLSVDKVSKTIYRPCCSNSAHFPDCNHGMAMLGLLELLASQGADENEMKNVALLVNSYWFPDSGGSGGCDVGGVQQKARSDCGV